MTSPLYTQYQDISIHGLIHSIRVINLVYLVLALREEIAAQAVVGFIVRAFRKVKNPRSREMCAAATRFIAYAPPRRFL